MIQQCLLMYWLNKRDIACWFVGFRGVLDRDMPAVSLGLQSSLVLKLLIDKIDLISLLEIYLIDLLQQNMHKVWI